MTTLELVLGAATVLLALALLVLVATRDTDGEADALDDDAVFRSVSDALRELDLDRNATRIEDHARSMREVHADIERMLTHPQDRGGFGEYQLETILADHLPPDSYGLQAAVVDGKRPDAHVDTPEGVLPIDAKFPLEAYERAREADDPTERATHEREFGRRVERQLEKIATDYVRPAEGTTDIALAFIPSEAVYYHLVTEEYELLREYADRGVLVVSPLTLGQKLAMIQAGVHARRLSERAEAVQAQLQRLGERFDAVAGDWDTAMRHLDNASARAADADQAFDRLRAEFDRVDRLDVEADRADEDGPA